MLREAYKVQNINNKISKAGLIRMYRGLLKKNKIKEDGAKLGAYNNRLKKLLRD
tara:strand:- start:602 stop:763 length:162 start_codon:yes stop_codon:yes gene_type:complete